MLDTRQTSRVGQRRNFVSPYTRWERMRNCCRRLAHLLIRIALPGAMALAALWWWIAG